MSSTPDALTPEPSTPTATVGEVVQASGPIGRKIAFRASTKMGLRASGGLGVRTSGATGLRASVGSRFAAPASDVDPVEGA